MRIWVAAWTMAACGVAATALAAIAPVTFSVNMSVQRLMGRFDPDRGDTVLVAGSWDGWATTNVMSPSGTPDIYTLTLQLPEGTWPQYKFVINPYGTSGGSGLIWEREGVGNRWTSVPVGGTNLPVVYFDDASAAVTNIRVTFAVDMSVQIQLGNFNPETDLVFVAGSWNWNAMGTPPLSRSETNTNVWTITLEFTNAIGATVNYKFLYVPYSGNTVWESDGVGPDGAQNRQFVFPNCDTNLPVVFFNNVSNTVSMVIVPITFYVNMAVQDAYGNFTPWLDSVSVAGEFNAWDAYSWQLAPTPTNQEVYTGTFLVTNVPGATMAYKFVINYGARWESDGVGPSGNRNRILTMPETALELPTAFFNNLDNLGTISMARTNDDQLVLSWAPGWRIRLQTAPSPNGPWSDVPDTQGVDSATVGISGTAFFRLTGP